MHRRFNKRGFTLVEMMVVVAVLVILFGIGIAIGPEIIDAGEEQLTIGTMRSLEGILEDYTSRVGAPVNNVGDFPRDWSGTIYEITSAGEAEDKSIQQFYIATKAIPDIEQGTYASMPTTLFTEEDEIIDGWQVPLIYCATTESTGNYFSFLPTYDRPFFASAGADGLWGNGTDEDSEDNIYSYQIGQ